MRILFVAAEAYPFAKVGGLGDVAGSLPKALQALGHEVDLIMPRYRGMDDWRVDLGPYNVPMGDGMKVAALKEGNLTPQIPVLMVDQLDYFDREGVYGFPDDGQRFGFFCRAVLEACRYVDFQPDVIHCNDWHSALIPAFLRRLYTKDALLSSARTLLTIHNLQWQGTFPKDLLDFLGLPLEKNFLHEGKLNFMKAGLSMAHGVSTVSPTYAREIQTDEYGYGLQGELAKRSEDLRGVVNGLDLEAWNPREDSFLSRPYDPTDEGMKNANKQSLRRELGLPELKAPLLGFVGRLFDQKGVDILVESLPQLLRRNLQLVILGSGLKEYEEALGSFAQEPNLSLSLRYDEGLAHRIYAGADIFLMPSRFEPCGLGQMISMRYGTVPLVRRTGGLADTVLGYGEDPSEATGFVFEQPTAEELVKSVDAALELYSQKGAWRKLRRRLVEQDFSWDRSARAYEEIYRELTSKSDRP